MRERGIGIRHILCLGAAIILAAGPGGAAGKKIKTIAAGLNYENLSRTVVWDGDTASSKIQANVISARADFGLAKGLVVSLSAGLSRTDFKGLGFNTLPIRLQYDAAPISGVALGAEVVAPLFKFSDFEISGAGRFVYSFGMSRTWSLEDFAVEGQATGKPSWYEVALGPRVAYLFFGPVVPYLEINARWLGAGFKMTETLDDLGGMEKKTVRGDFSFSVALGVDAAVNDRISVKAKAGILPYAGGVDGLVSIGVLYKF